MWEVLIRGNYQRSGNRAQIDLRDIEGRIIIDLACTAPIWRARRGRKYVRHDVPGSRP